MRTWTDIATWLEANQPFNGEYALDLLTGYFGRDVQIDTTMDTRDTGIVTVGTTLRFFFENPDYRPDDEKAERWENSKRLTESRDGYYIAPLSGPFMSFIQKAERRALLNALWQFGVEVKIEVDAVETGPAGLANVNQAKATLPHHTTDDGPICDDCGGPITVFTSKKGSEISVDYQLKGSQKDYGKDLCNKCSGKRWAVANKKAS